MPELPEVHALAADLDGRLRGRVVDRLQYCPTCQTGGKPLADRVLSRLLK